MEKSKISINVEGGFLFCGGWTFLKSVSVGSTFIREMRVLLPRQDKSIAIIVSQIGYYNKLAKKTVNIYDKQKLLILTVDY